MSDGGRGGSEEDGKSRDGGGDHDVEASERVDGYKASEVGKRVSVQRLLSGLREMMREGG